MRDPLRTLSARVGAVTAVVAVVAVIVTALVAVPISIRSANAAVRDELAERSRLAVALLEDERPLARERVARQLRADGIDLYLIRRGTADRPGLPPDVVRRVAAGTEVDTSATVDDETVFVAGRPLAGGRQFGVVLTRPADTAAVGRVLGRVWLALLAGLVGGLLAGAALARVIARPIRLAARAASRLSAGERGIRLDVRPPAEVAELAEALNALATALQTSEGRERDFLLSVSHELRTPLSSIRGYAEALADGVVGPDGAPEAGAIVLAEAERLDRLIADLLVLARLEAADLPLDVLPVDLVDLLTDAVAAWAPRCAPDGPRLLTELPQTRVWVETDPGRIRQVIDGLCENALRVVPGGAPLVLAVRAGRDGGVFEVRDGGPGFTDDDLAVAFQRGALHQRYRGIRKVGSGLGLALAARLVGRLGGHIEAGHAPEGGARFTVTLPYAARP